MFNKRLTLFLGALLAALFQLHAQDSIVSSETVAQYKTESKKLLQYLEDTFNFLGDSTQPVSEKEIIINQSYIKIFRDDKVQIEDDLDEKRRTPLNKDVQAYMKDIMFFFKTVKFRFEVRDIQQFVNDSGAVYFKVTFNRNLKGVLVTGDTVDNNRIRYMEVNLNPAEKSLKIASIYTTKLNERENIVKWWNSLSQSWKNYFGKSVLVYDTLPLAMVSAFTDTTLVTPVWKKPQNSDSSAVLDTIPLIKVPDTLKTGTKILYLLVKKLMQRESVDISGNLTIKNIQPLAELDNLHTLVMENTAVDDLTPLHNLSKLERLDVSGSAVSSLTPLRYLWNLKEIDFSKTAVNSLSPLTALTKLESVNGDSTAVASPAPLQYHPVLNTLRLALCNISRTDSLTHLPSLTYLDLHGNPLERIDSVGRLAALSYLNLDSTSVHDLTPLASLKNLSVLRINHTGVADLTPLEHLPALKIIYCDNSGITREEAMRFMKKKPESLVIFNSKKLEAWWNGLPKVWKRAIKTAAGIEEEPTKITLHKLVHITTLDLAGEKSVTSLTPASMLYELQTLHIDNTSVTSLEPLRNISSLRILTFNNTFAADLTPLESMPHLREIHMDGTPVSVLAPLASCKELESVYCDNTKTGREAVSALLDALPGVLVVFRTSRL